MDTRVSSQVQTAEALYHAKAAMVIPCYQRPYVWSDEDVARLFEDIVAACDACEPHYYIGTVLTATSSDSAKLTYELIDGQQRMTTLVLMALAFRKYAPHSPLAQLATLAHKPRLTFAIREQVEALLGFWAGLGDYHPPGDELLSTNPYLTSLAAALKVSSDRFEQLLKARKHEGLEEVGDFLFRKVKWVNNTVPRSMDLNRLFATMNTRGLQLEQTDILKSQLLRKVTQRKSLFDAIWQACENLDNYFERNLRKLFPRAPWDALSYDQLASYCPERFPASQEEPHRREGLTIAELATSPPEEEAHGEDREIYCRSIISFGLLLLHTYRIFRSSRGETDLEPRLSDARLNEGFSDFVSRASEEDVTSFLGYLWQVRYQFDRWVVKWVERLEDGEEHLRLSSVSFNRSHGSHRLSRSPQEASNLSQLQSVRHFTGERSAQYWLTPFLGALVKQKPTERSKVEALLEDIDNQLSLARTTQKETSFALLGGDDLPTEDIESICRHLREPRGTGFAHYWFQKMEYVLWREKEQPGLFATSEVGRSKLERYRITSKNSVEHVHPQREEYGHSLDHELLHSFGNLVLLNPRENSSYSNQTVHKKRADFISKPSYDSLKLAHIFLTMGGGEWDEDAISRHLKAMLSLLRRHYQSPRPKESST